MLLNRFIFPVAYIEMDHGIDHANIRGLVSSNFFIMTLRTKHYLAKYVTGSYIITALIWAPE